MTRTPRSSQIARHAAISCSLALIASWAASPSASAEDAFAEVCRQKLRAIYKATAQFAADHDGYLPPAWMSPDVRKPFVGRKHWFAHIEPYLVKTGERTRIAYRAGRRQPAALVSHCPANPYWYGGNGPYCLGYAWNTNLGFRAIAKGKPTGPAPVRLADVASPERTVLIVDAGQMPKHAPRCVYHASHPRDVGAWHDGKAYVLFLDGHTEALRPAAIKEAWFKVKLKPAARGR